MPINEYKCKTCKNEFEHFESSYKNVKEWIHCPECGQDAKKQLSPGSFVINGFSEANGYAGNASK